MFVAMSLATLDLSAVLNDEPSCEWTAGTITHPEPFAVLARPRSRVMEELIRSVEDEFPWTDADAEHLSHIDWKKGCNWSKT
ncbi:cytochrome P450 oxidoreductase [Pyrrhoderma noxium]|uniref:Cytochrome P450 oxidoreductase n=1 Tax=Pyrrhoderma noxium TaxID=2282107 RepID=A0A286U5N7_9AGAM|nr:cytochrome P450 oxidoreductase [Pyrrhoderma noxium]